MAPKKRTGQTSKPPTSPTTSTSHEVHHRLRHTGPSISTRSSASAAPSKSPHAPAHASETTPTEESCREKKSLAQVPPPGARTPLTKFLHVLLILVLLVFGWYIFGLVVLLERMKEEVGWWGIIMGDSRRMPAWTSSSSEGWTHGSDPSARQGDDLESSLNALADALGISPVQVASAMKPLVPQASLSSVASKSGATGGSEALSMLYGDTKRNGGDGADTTRLAQEFAKRLGGDAEDEDVADGGVL